LNQKNWFVEASKQIDRDKHSELLKKFLPTKPLLIPLQYWWVAHLGVLGEKDIQVCISCSIELL
jgi:hypothetical protein